MGYITHLQVHVVSCNVRYMRCCVRMDYYGDIYYANLEVYLLSESELGHVSGQSNSVNCFGIDFGFGLVNHTSGSDYLIVNDVAYIPFCIYRDRYIVEIGNLHGYFSPTYEVIHICVRP